MKCFNSCRLATMWQQYTRKYCWANLRNLFLKSLVRTSVQSTCLARYAVLGPFTPSVSFVWRCFKGQTASAPLSYMSGPQVNWAPGSDLRAVEDALFLGGVRGCRQRNIVYRTLPTDRCPLVSAVAAVHVRQLIKRMTETEDVFTPCSSFRRM